MLSIKSTLFSIAVSVAPLVSAIPTGYRPIGSSGCTAQMVFVPPYTDTVVFIDNYHVNFGGPGFDPFQVTQAAVHSKDPYVQEGTTTAVFGTEYNLTSNTTRPLNPVSNTFCSAGSFFPNGTLVNLSGAEASWPDDPANITEGFDKLRYYEAGPCSGDCDSDWVEQATGLQSKRWYPSALTMVDGSILLVGGSNTGLLVLNEASINVQTYEIIPVNGSIPKKPVTLPILVFTEKENLDPGKSYNLYPILHLLPNKKNASEVFTIAGIRATVWDYGNDKVVTNLPNISKQPRTFPSSAASVLLPLEYPDYSPTVLVCGGSSGDMPNPKTLADCYTIEPQVAKAKWERDDDMPNGGQVMSSPIMLPDGKILLIGGAHNGSAGGFMADDPVFAPILYDPKAAKGSRWTTMPSTIIPRLYHSCATLLPSGEVLVAGSNPAVFYSDTGNVPEQWPHFFNNKHPAALLQQQRNTSAYPTEYRVELFSPPYMEATDRPIIQDAPAHITYGGNFTLDADLKGDDIVGEVQITLMATGFHTHTMGMGMRSMNFGFTPPSNTTEFTVYGPRDATVMPPGVYLLFVVSDGIPSKGVWVALG